MARLEDIVDIIMAYMKEEWKTIPGFESYQVSDLGRVRNMRGQILKQRMNGARENNKYFAVDLQTRGDGSWRERRRVKKVHRLVLTAFGGLPKEGQIACHKNDIRTDNRAENLYWGTHKSNAADAIRSGAFYHTHPGFGEDHHSVKYSDELINTIRKEYTGKRGDQIALSRKYGIPYQYVSTILAGRVRIAA